MNGMWDCPECGAGNITADIPFCPHCQTPRAQVGTEASADATPSAGTDDAGTAGTDSPTAEDDAASGSAAGKSALPKAAKKG